MTDMDKMMIEKVVDAAIYALRRGPESASWNEAIYEACQAARAAITTRAWQPHLDYAGEQMRPGEFRDPPVTAYNPDDRLREAATAFLAEADAGLCPPFAQVQDWFMHSLTLEQRRKFLVVWLPINRFDVKALTTEMQFVALRHFHQRYRAALASVGRNPEGHDRETGHGRNDEHAVPEGQTPSTKSGAPDNG